jgi:transcriptional regulator EpsA
LTQEKRVRSDIDVPQIFALVSEVVTVRRHIDLMKWLQGDVQAFLPHDILLAAWGDFNLGLVHYDVVSALPGVRSDNAASESMTPLLKDLFDRWVENGRKPLSLHAGEDGFQWDGDDQTGAIRAAMRNMRSSLIDGISDQRGRHDCLYVLLNSQPRRDRRESTSLKFLLPYIDNALRQVELMPHQQPVIQAKLEPEPVPDDADSTLSQREVEILEWVAKGKTNGEIGSILNVSSFTVKNHMQRIFKKLDVFSRAQAVSAFLKSNTTVG